jgi:hypothetical protein
MMTEEGRVSFTSLKWFHGAAPWQHNERDFGGRSIVDADAKYYILKGWEKTLWLIYSKPSGNGHDTCCVCNTIKPHTQSL